MLEFTPFPKLARLFREAIITEKLDGTNAQVLIQPFSGDAGGLLRLDEWTTPDGQHLEMIAGSRNRFIVPGLDNYGFAAWVQQNAKELRELGPGRHFGEWWGRGIQRNYGLEVRRFSLFNTVRWCRFNEVPSVINGTTKVQERLPRCCDLVPVLYRGEFSTDRVHYALELLRQNGSVASPLFPKPEGVVVFHVAANAAFKVTLEGDQHKSALG